MHKFLPIMLLSIAQKSLLDNMLIVIKIEQAALLEIIYILNLA